MKKLLFIPASIFILGLLFFYYNKKNQSVNEVSAKKGPIMETIYGLGTVQSENVYTLKLGVITLIKKLFVKEGEKVKKGQRLLEFDEEGIQSQYAPFDGTVTQINYFAGESVFPQSPILTIMDLNNRFISVSMDQEGALRVRPKQRALLSFENSAKAITVEGSVRAIFPKQGQLIAHIEAKNLSAQILPGMTADVAIIVEEKKAALLVPLKAIHQGQIDIKRNGTLISMPITLGVVDAEWGELLSPNLLESDLIQFPKE